ncbi:DUF2461 domain-containing protein [Ferruginibacter paludis]|uniref:DUF2461 domain-containing protein n=1 Tax=Ferruginibacter paludis TaxID=1310417 RepID=UPI0025B5ACBB|nr:DUF2461 domain-containing protein [Ferruginibacter paludis]MDN3659264.1 DUF2461 domain-containing protein [Ferruginibacter paludis]
MLQSATIRFLKDLQDNNNKPWFDAHRQVYENAKADLQKLVGQLIPAIAGFDEPIGTLQVKDCTFRINRDVRFSKNKSPYKNNMAAYFSRGGKKASVAGYYFHCEPGKSYAAGGFYSPMPTELAKIRQEIDYNFNEWKKIIDNKTFKKYFPNGVDGIESLQRPPKGYDETNPAIHYLKMKHFIVSKPFTDAELQSKTLVKDVAKVFETMKPMLDFLNLAVE